MAKDAEGRKFNRIPGYTKQIGGKTIKAKPHVLGVTEVIVKVNKSNLNL